MVVGEWIECGCGCRQVIWSRDERGRPRRFVRGHHTVIKHKPCRVCGIEEYARYPRRGWICKPCASKQTMRKMLDKYGTWRNYSLQTRYGISEDDWTAMLMAQGGTCALCRARTATDLDHDHRTGEVRGALCTHCNSALGVLGDSKMSLARAAAYLEGGWDAIAE